MRNLAFKLPTFCINWPPLNGPASTTVWLKVFLQKTLILNAKNGALFLYIFGKINQIYKIMLSGEDFNFIITFPKWKRSKNKQQQKMWQQFYTVDCGLKPITSVFRTMNHAVIYCSVINKISCVEKRSFLSLSKIIIQI